MSSINDKDLGRVLAKTAEPLILREFIKKWSVCNWNLDKWCTIFGDKAIPFRTLSKSYLSEEPCWERRCDIVHMAFQQFLSRSQSQKSREWMYFDYKYLHQWFSSESELIKEISWKDFGHPEKTAADTTLWIGSKGAHTPAHQDTYGVNIIAQVYGKKRWILFPPETGGLKPTRIPYEESSVYSKLNFYCPKNLNDFNGLSGCRMVELSAGDALVLPRGWWHYVQNVDPVNIALNCWLPHEKDTSSQVSEALIKIFVAQICKDLPQETSRLLVNPNEDDIIETPLTVLFLQLEMVAKKYLDAKRKLRRVKRQRTGDETMPADEPEIDIKSLIDDNGNNLKIVPSITSNDLLEVLKGNIKEFIGDGNVDEDEMDGSTSNLCLTKAMIDAFSQSNVIDVVKQNLFERLS